MLATFHKSLSLTCLNFLLISILWTLDWGCLGIRELQGSGYLEGWQTNGNWLGLTLFCLWISIRHYHILNACSQEKESVRILENENRKLLVEQAEPQAYFGKEKTFCEEASKNINFPCAQQQQVGWGIRVCPPVQPKSYTSQRKCPPLSPGTLLCLIQMFIYVILYKAFWGGRPFWETGCL